LQDALVRAATAGSEYRLNLPELPRDPLEPAQAAWEGRRELIEPFLDAFARAKFLVPTVDDPQIRDLADGAIDVMDQVTVWNIESAKRAWDDANEQRVLEQAVRGVAEARRALLIDYPTGDGWAAEAWRRVKASGTAPADDANTPTMRSGEGRR